MGSWVLLSEHMVIFTSLKAGSHMFFLLFFVWKVACYSKSKSCWWLMQFVLGAFLLSKFCRQSVCWSFHQKQRPRLHIPLTITSFLVSFNVNDDTISLKNFSTLLSLYNLACRMYPSHCFITYLFLRPFSYPLTLLYYLSFSSSIFTKRYHFLR